MDEGGFPIEKASLKVKSRDVGFQTTKYGEYWRILLPGVYKLEVCDIVFSIYHLINTWAESISMLLSSFFRCMLMDMFLKRLNLWL